MLSIPSFAHGPQATSLGFAEKKNNKEKKETGAIECIFVVVVWW